MSGGIHRRREWRRETCVRSAENPVRCALQRESRIDQSYQKRFETALLNKPARRNRCAGLSPFWVAHRPFEHVRRHRGAAFLLPSRPPPARARRGTLRRCCLVKHDHRIFLRPSVNYMAQKSKCVSIFGIWVT